MVRRHAANYAASHDRTQGTARYVSVRHLKMPTLVLGTVVYFCYGTVSMSVTTTPSATAPAQMLTITIARPIQDCEFALCREQQVIRVIDLAQCDRSIFATSFKFRNRGRCTE